MKRIAYSFLLFLVLSPASGFAQRKLMYGITVGPSISARYEHPGFEGSSYITQSIIGYLAGFEIGYFDWNSLSFSAEILYTEKGLSRNGEDFATHYLEIPLSIKIPIIARIFLFAGPILGFGIETDHPNDFGIFGGLGLTIPYANLDFFLQASYAYGLVDISGPHYYSLTDGAAYPKEYSRDIRLQLGILFGK